MRETSLMEIPGIGPTRARTLLRRFGSLSGLAAADPKDVEAAVGLASARAVREYLQAARRQDEPAALPGGHGEGGRVRSA
jgi:ERCC4-type nuclease